MRPRPSSATTTCPRRSQHELRQRGRAHLGHPRHRVPGVRADRTREAVMAGWLQLLLIVALLVASTPLLGSYLAKVYANGPAPGDRVFGPVDNMIYRVTGVD